MGQISGTVYHSDGSPASGRRVSGVASGVIGGMVGPTTTDSRGRFTLSWSSDAGLAKVFVDGKEKWGAIRNGEHVTVPL